MSRGGGDERWWGDGKRDEAGGDNATKGGDKTKGRGEAERGDDAKGRDETKGGGKRNCEEMGRVRKRVDWVGTEYRDGTWRWRLRAGCGY